MRIIGPPSATLDKVGKNISDKGWYFFHQAMLLPLWNTAVEYGVDPVGVVAQSLHETGNGLFPGNVRVWFQNTCGLKVRDPNTVLQIIGASNPDHPLVHAQFASWHVGAEAHVQHLRAYAGWAVEEEYEIVDPRYIWVKGKYSLTHFSELNGKWAPSPTYGDRVELKMQEISK